MGSSLERTFKHKTRLIILALSLVHSLEDLQKKEGFGKTETFFFFNKKSLISKVPYTCQQHYLLYLEHE